MKKLKVCGICSRERLIWKNFQGIKYCQLCWNLSQPKKLKKKSKRINPISLQRREDNKIYAIERVAFLLEHPMCQVHIIGCYNQSSQVHHAKGRTGSLFLDKRYWIAVCDFCHKFVENNPTWAKENKFSLNRI